MPLILGVAPVLSFTCHRISGTPSRAESPRHAPIWGRSGDGVSELFPAFSPHIYSNACLFSTAIFSLALRSPFIC